MACRVYIETLFSGVPYCVMLTLVGYMNMLGYYQLIFYTLLFFPFLLFQPIKYLSLLCYFSLPCLQILFYFSSSLLISSLLLLPSQHDRTMCRLPKIPRYKPPPPSLKIYLTISQKFYGTKGNICRSYLWYKELDKDNSENILEKNVRWPIFVGLEKIRQKMSKLRFWFKIVAHCKIYKNFNLYAPMGEGGQAAPDTKKTALDFF